MPSAMHAPRPYPKRASRRWCGRWAPLRLAVSLLASSSTAALGGVASASPGELIVSSWEAPPGCPSAADVLDRVEQLVGPAVRWPAHARVRGRMHVRAHATWQLDLEIEDGSNSVATQARTIEGPRCDELGQAAALAITLALGLEPTGAAAVPAQVTAERGSVVDDGRARAAASVNAVAAGADEPQELAASGTSVHGSLGASAMLDGGSLGGAALGPSVEADLRWRRVAAGVYGLWLPAQRQALSGSAEQYVDFSLLGAGVRGCYAALDGWMGLDACAGFEVGAVRAEPHAFEAARQVRALWLSPHAGVALGWNILDTLALRSRLDVLFPLGDERYVVQVVESAAMSTREEVHRTPSATLRVSVGLTGSFGQR